MPPTARSPRTTLIIPAYNEADRLEAGFSRLLAAAEAGRCDLDELEVIFVDDGSSDGTAEAAMAIVARLPHGQVIVQPENRGKGAAVARGVVAARSELVVFTDADMAIDPRQLPSLIKALEIAPVAVGSRAVRGHIDYGSSLRTRAGRIFNFLVRLLSKVRMRDTQCGWKGARTEYAKILFHLITIEGFAFDVELLARARLLGIDVIEVPVSWSDVTGSHVHLATDSVRMLFDLLIARLRSTALPGIIGLTVVDPIDAEAIAAACRGSELEGAPIVTSGSGRRSLLATGVSPEIARRSLEALAATIGGSIETIPIEQIRSADSIVAALSER